MMTLLSSLFAKRVCLLVILPPPSVEFLGSSSWTTEMKKVCLFSRPLLLVCAFGIYYVYNSAILFQNFDHQEATQTLMMSIPSQRRTNSKQRTSRKLPRVLAIVFPQFHRDPLNDQLWGEGFTDWNNLRAAPATNRLGYEIPRPTELGYYDLANQATRKIQGDLAHEYGIDGFVYHHYWFYDETHPGPNLHRPLEEMLKDGHPDVPFFLNWCAINWVDTWSGKAVNASKGGGDNLLQGQTFPDPEDASVQEHYDWLKQFFHHPNYIKVRGQPVLMLHQKKPRAFPILQKFRRLAESDGFPGLYIVVGMGKTHDDLFPEGKDQGQRFNRFPKDTVNRTVAYPQPYEITSKQVLKVPGWCLKDPKPQGHSSPGFQIPGILTSFDNTPRRDFESAFLWSADEPDKVVERFYQSVYAAVYYETCCFPLAQEASGDDERLIVINSMNEWAEGMALEPSNVFGRKLLEAVRDAKAEVLHSNCTTSMETKY